MSQAKTILFIDDNPVDRTLMDRLLSKCNFNVLLASTAKDGLILAEEHLPDLILLDILLPGISGIEVCKKLKNKELTKRIPIIFYTSIDTPKHLIDYKSYGAIDYLQKTMTSDMLIKQIKIALNVN
ncbi:MAG: response regulator [Candidatus Omnitrophica bacterium]|nr:response regulator [Candidatus Omnitrophota bacterium]